MFGFKAWRHHLANKANRRIIAATDEHSKHARFVAEQATSDADAARRKIQAGKTPTARQRKALQEQVLGRKVP